MSQYFDYIPVDQQCIFDFQSTGDRQIALDTSRANINMQQDAEVLCEF